MVVSGWRALLSADAVLPFWAYVTREDVDTAHAAGLSVAPWATSDPSVMRELIACGVDAIGTNHPDIAARQILLTPSAILERGRYTAGDLTERLSANDWRLAGALIRRKDFQLFLTSFLALYAELLCIRWMPAHVRFLSYFTNFILLASFLGLGVGILSVRRKLPLGPRTFPLLLLFAAILIAATRFELKIGSAGVLYYGAGESGTAPPENALVLPAAFLLVSLLFVCIGRPLGILLQEVTPPLEAYAFDIGGSLAGIAAFFLLSWYQQPPAIWFVGLLVITLLLVGPTWRDRAIMVVPLAISAIIAFNIGQGYWWSPYYKIGLTPTDNGDGWALNVNESGHQAMLPSDEKEPFYRAPYELFGSGQFQHVLIIGAGSGSDTAIGLKYGNVGHIDAVEIDPVIAQLGRQYHPDAAVLRPARDGPRRRRARVHPQEHRQVRPDHLRPARLADADLAVFESAAGELPVHRGSVPGSARAPDPRRGDGPLQLLPRRLADPKARGHAPGRLRSGAVRPELRRLGSGRRAGRRPATADSAGRATRSGPAVHRDPCGRAAVE